MSSRFLAPAYFEPWGQAAFLLATGPDLPVWFLLDTIKAALGVEGKTGHCKAERSVAILLCGRLAYWDFYRLKKQRQDNMLKGYICTYIHFLNAKIHYFLYPTLI